MWYMTEITDYGEVFGTLIEKTEEYILGNNLHAMVLGISGGIDSTVVAAVAAASVVVANKLMAKKVIAEIDFNDDGESDATMIDADGDGEVDTIVFHEV